MPTPFSEEAVERGITYLTPNRIFGNGVAFADLDEDGDPDVVVIGRGDGLVGVYENDGTGYFTDRSADSGIPLTFESAGIVAFDYDADGDLDLYITRFDEANLLMRNLGGFVFQNVTGTAEVGDTGPGTGTGVGDYDGDGWLDMLVPNYGSPDRFYRNRGDGMFDDLSESLGLDDPWRGMEAVFFDLDWDGDADLYVSNDKKIRNEFSMHNRLYENVNGSLTDISAGSGAGVNIYSMGVAVGDFDLSGLQDLYCTNVGFGAATDPNNAPKHWGFRAVRLRALQNPVH